MRRLQLLPLLHLQVEVSLLPRNPSVGQRILFNNSESQTAHLIFLQLQPGSLLS
jgi:hypothetical protein